MKSIILIFLLLIFCPESNAQQGSKIKLRNVSVSDSRLPTVFLYGKEFTARHRNIFLKQILTSKFYDPDFKIEGNFEEFISKDKYKFIHEGPVQIIIDSRKVSNRNLFFKYQEGSDFRVINKDKLNSLIVKIKEVYIDSSKNGILSTKKLKKDIKIIKSEIIEFQLKNYKVDNETKIKLKKMKREKKRKEKEFSKIPLITIKILTTSNF